MNTVINFAVRFLSEGFEPVMVFLPICLFLRLVYLNWRRKSSLADKADPIRETVFVFFMVFMIMLFTQTFIYNTGINEICPIPFYIIIKQIVEADISVFTLRGMIFNVFGNIGIFIPVGIFIPALFKTNFSQTVLRGFFISLIIETVQLPLPRTSDVDDLILNTAGAAIGYGIYYLYKRLSQKYNKKQVPLR